ncbi:hypothetical protein AB0H76_24700 [Nocardia sp. NPDC050712]|uniref:hypothetical protein n=1 Tax=Nocardia sp. NPDC050712 TaxID=3155518 RepID=UPI0033EC7832
MPVRPLTFRELLDVPFALVQANIAVLAGLAAVGLVLAELFVLGFTLVIARLTGDSDAGIRWGAILAMLIAVWALRFLLRGTTVALGLADVAGHRLGRRAALERLRAVVVPLLLFELPYTLIWTVVFGLLALLVTAAPLLGLTLLSMLGLLVLPLVGWLRARHYVAVPVIFAEQAGRAVAEARTKLLVSGKTWALAGLWLAHRGLLLLMMLPLFGLWLFLSDFSGTRMWTVVALTTTMLLLFLAVGEIVEAATRVVCYLDLRCRREGLDIRIPEVR